MSKNAGAWEHAWSESKVVASADISLPFLKFGRHSRVLDIGSGNGVMLRKLEEHFGIEPVGIDIVAFKKPGFLFVRADAQNLPFRDCCFDVVYGLGSIEHCERTALTLDETFRILKNSGQALFTVPNKLSLHTLFERPLRQRLGFWSIGLEQSFSVLQMCEMFTSSGFVKLAFKMNYWDTRGQGLPARLYMLLDNALSRVSKSWGFFVCMFGVKEV